MSEMSPVLRRIQHGRLCTGCGACAAISEKIRIAQSEDGFNRPIASDALSSSEDQAIEAICPGLGIKTDQHRKTSPFWGRIIGTRTGHATDASLRHRASSGGALSAILVHLLKTGSVDCIVQTTADPADPVANRTVVSTSRDQIANAAGSRYAPSSPLADIERHLATGKRFAFVGKPCDVAALRAMACRDPRIGQSVVCMISFFCAGVPSRRGADAILQRLSVNPCFLKSFSYRGNGWPGAATAELNDGSKRAMSYRDSWGGILSKHVQFRCKICADGVGSTADIVCADAWHGDEQGYPSFSEAKGRSLILSRTDLGEEILQAAIDAREIAVQPLDVSEIARMQPGQVSRTRMLVARLAALWLTAQPRPSYVGFDLLPAARGASYLMLLRNFLGTGRRVILGRR